MTTAGASEQRLASLKGRGSPLPDGLRTDMEGRFGTDFGAVRIHTDGEADGLNRTLRAKAFTHKTDIYFSAGQYDADSKKGKHLLAHELTHVVQQTGSGPQTFSPGVELNSTGMKTSLSPGDPDADPTLKVAALR